MKVKPKAQNRVLGLAAFFAGLLAVTGCASAPAPAPVPLGSPTVTLSSEHFTIQSNLPDPFPETILKDCETALEGYRVIFGIDLIPDPTSKYLIFAKFAAKTGGQIGLWINPDRSPMEIHYGVKSESALNPPGKGGPHHVFGFAHEFGHAVIMFGNADFGQGLADYMGSEVVDYMQARLGDAAWPRPYDFVKSDGTGRLAEWIKTPAGLDQETSFAVGFAKAAESHGKDLIRKAVERVKGPEPNPTYRTYSASAFIKAMAEIAGDPDLEALFTVTKPKPLPTKAIMKNVTSAELWSAGNHAKAEALLLTRWRGHINGILDGKPVQMILQLPPGKRDGASAVAYSDLEGELSVTPLSEDWVQVFYQPETRRTYLVGRFLASPSGAIVENDAVDKEGFPLGLNSGLK
jgi:hypothetical protein